MTPGVLRELWGNRFDPSKGCGMFVIPQMLNPSQGSDANLLG